MGKYRIDIEEKDTKQATRVLRDQMSSASKAAGILNIKRTSRGEGFIEVESSLTPGQIRAAIHTTVKYAISLLPEDSTKQKKVQVYPADYAGLRVALDRLGEKFDTAEQERGEALSKVKGLEAEIATEKEKVTSMTRNFEIKESDYQKQLRQKEIEIRTLNAKCQTPLGIQDYLTQTMITANNVWEAFRRSYDDTIRVLAGTAKTTPQELENRIASYVPTEQRADYKAIEPKLHDAREARNYAKKNPLAMLSGEAVNVLEEAERIERENQAVFESEEELKLVAKDCTMRVGLTTEGKDVLLILPFKASGIMPPVESGFMVGLESYMDTKKMNYMREEQQGLVRYRIKGAGTQKRNQVIRVIKEQEDRFTALGMKREVVEIYTH